MANGYWNAHSDFDWQDQCGMFDECEDAAEAFCEEPADEYTPLELLEVHARVWDAILDTLFGGKR